jgi:hypothetical protein
MYYPLSQITSNLYTNGNEFVIKSNNSPYVGYYWKTSTEKYYTGKTPQDTPSEEIIPSINKEGIKSPDVIDSYYNQYDDLVNNYINITSSSLSPPLPPVFSLTIPTQQDYQIGEFRRYFCKKTNEISYLEISKETYDKLIGEDPQILYQLYQPFNIPWRLTGDKEQVYKTNRNIVELTIKQQKLPQFDLYLKKDYIKYYQ